VLVPWVSRDYARDQLRAVRLSRRRPGRGPGWSYLLELETGGRTLRLREAYEPGDIRRHGRDLADALALPLRDETGG
jgi:hypothetical protein